MRATPIVARCKRWLLRWGLALLSSVVLCGIAFIGHDAWVVSAVLVAGMAWDRGLVKVAGRVLLHEKIDRTDGKVDTVLGILLERGEQEEPAEPSARDRHLHSV